MSNCGHEIWDKDTYLADGYCPICMMKEIERLRTALDEIEKRDCPISCDNIAREALCDD